MVINCLVSSYLLFIERTRHLQTIAKYLVKNIVSITTAIIILPWHPALAALGIWAVVADDQPLCFLKWQLSKRVIGDPGDVVLCSDQLPTSQ